MENRTYRSAVDDYGDMVYRIALNQTRSVADADDITQTVFLKLYEKAPDDLSADHLKAWLIRVTVNECKSLWRTLWRRRVELREINDADMRDPVFVQPDHEALYATLGQLPEKCRIVVHLFYFEEYSTREIAALLGVKEPTVRTRLARARKVLRQQLKEAWDDDQPEPEPKPLRGNDGRHPCSC